MNRIITLTTDFGLSDGFVGVMKGVILSINPNATIVDVTHDIAPQNIEQGAFLFANSVKYFPVDAIHVVVVDPGVGSTRRPIAIQRGETIFVAPDNGVLSFAVGGTQGFVARDYGDLPEAIGSVSARFPSALTSFAAPLRAVHLNRPEYWLPQVSSTFHGRDVFAPCAAHLSLGVPLEALGEPISNWKRLGFLIGSYRMGDSILGRVIHIDRFGNVVTNIRQEMLVGIDHSRISVNIGRHVLRGLHRTYSDVEQGQLVALVGSSGHLEVAERDGNAAQALGIRVGDGVILTRLDKD